MSFIICVDPVLLKTQGIKRSSGDSTPTSTCVRFPLIFLVVSPENLPSSAAYSCLKEHCPDPVTFTNAAFNQLQFNRLDPNLFPIPQFSLKAPRPLENFVDKFDFESGMGSAEPRLPPRTYVMTAGMHTGVRPILPPKVWDSGEKFHPAATELAAIHEANMAKRPVGRSTPTQVLVVENKVDLKGIEFDKKILSPSAFEKFKKRERPRNRMPPGGFRPGWVNGGNVKVITLGTSSAMPSKYRNGMCPSFPHVKSLTSEKLAPF
jgi:ribonuclease Z